MKGITRLCTTTLLGATLALSAGFASADVAKVAVSQIVEHPALDATRKGLYDGLIELGYVDGETLSFDYQTAQGNPAIAVQIAKQFVGQQPDVLVGIATPSAQALASSTKNLPVVFTAVTDPVGANLVTQLEQPGGNVTGLSDLSPVGQHVALMAEIVPELKSIGVVYNPGEANSVALVDLLKAAATERGVEVVEATVLKSSEVLSAAQIVGSKTDVIYAPTDNTVASAIDALVIGATQAKTPIVGAETSYVDSGALAALGFDYYQVGVQTAAYVDAILKGTPAGELDVKVAVGSDLAINKAQADKLGLTLPAAVLERATTIKE
uniref:ABC transporter substrate-binding protein n=1 Tax=Thaumasiovibrio occultus TaxID=1891184 RepID=UPI000B364803|nr:ABC transporter substrate-binding protein [Thaumasiovibrio occultus]